MVVGLHTKLVVVVIVVEVAEQEGKKNDSGLLTRGMWQQSKMGTPLVLWAEDKFGIRPTRIIPVLTNLANLRIDEYTRIIYLNPLIQKANLYSDAFWANPQWMHISDLEKLAAIAEEGNLDIENLLSEKNSKYPAMQFDDFLIHYLKGFKKKFVYNKLFETATDFLKNTKESF